MAMDTKVRPPRPQPPIYYVGIDGTPAVDTAAFGNLWSNRFSWTNLLAKLPTDGNRRKDSARHSLPIRRTGHTVAIQQNRRVVAQIMFADTCIMPEGLDGSGVDPLWAGTDANSNLSEIKNACNFIRTSFISSPHYDTTNKKLGTTGDLSADLIYLSAHGVFTGRIFGEASLHKLPQGTSNPENIFELQDPDIVPFSGPKWVIAACCSALDPGTWERWADLMLSSDPDNALRGVLGYKGLSPGPDDAARLNIKFVNHLDAGASMVTAWRLANEELANDTDFESSRTTWAAVCNAGATNDTIRAWNARALNSIKTNPPPVLAFDNDNPNGTKAVKPPEPYRVRWLNSPPGLGQDIDDPNLKVAVVKAGQTVTIGVSPIFPVHPDPDPKKFPVFSEDTIITLTLVFIATRFRKAVDIDAMFTVIGKHNVSQINKNSSPPNDTWTLKLTGAAAVVTLTLQCKSAIPPNLTSTSDLGPPYSQGLLWISASIMPPPPVDPPNKAHSNYDFKDSGVQVSQ